MRPDSPLRRWIITLTGGLFAIGVAVAAPALWHQLSSAQQVLIKPALLTEGGDFDKLPESRRGALVKGADRWLAMTPAQRNTATQQFQQWQLLSPAQKVAVLERRERFRKMTPDQRKALLDTREQFLDMSIERQTSLRDEFADLQPQLEGLTGQPLTPTDPTTPGSPSPFGLPLTTLPNNATTLPIPLLAR
ncbi:MAG: DUF3106 domain-containing protein [Pseudomonadota bacterium]